MYDPSSVGIQPVKQLTLVKPAAHSECITQASELNTRFETIVVRRGDCTKLELHWTSIVLTMRHSVVYNCPFWSISYRILLVREVLFASMIVEWLIPSTRYLRASEAVTHETRLPPDRHSMFCQM